MAWGRAAVGLVVAAAVGVAVVSGGSRDDSAMQRYLPKSNELRTVVEYGRARNVDVKSLGEVGTIQADRRWLAQARPLGPGAPRWARRMYRRSLVVLRAVTNRRGAVVAGLRPGWEYVWPRDASAVAMAFATAGYRGEARRIVDFLGRLDLGAAARFQRDGTPVAGRAAQGDAAGWAAAAAREVGVRVDVPRLSWRDRADYQEGKSDDYLGNAVASTAAAPEGTSAGDLPARRLAERGIRRGFGVGDVLVREAGNPGSGLDSSAAWAVRPFRLPSLYSLARRTLLRIAGRSGLYGIVPSEDWGGGIDPWTAPTAWTAWSLAALGERRASLRLMAALRRDATPVGFLPERVDARTGIPTSTTPLAWSHAFAILTLHQLWPCA
ncbi:MAG TPA: glycoside hydrolase family 15 protein [Solirubrobacterales bacterium]